MPASNSWRYRLDGRQRDLRLDFLRGYLIFVMTVNHLGMGPSWAFRLTGNNALWVTAAEGFVLISGVVFGMVYGKRSRERGWEWTLSKVAGRAAQLYLVAVAWQLCFGTLDFWQRSAFNRSTNLPLNYFDFLENALFQVRELILGVDLLPMYAVLLPWGVLVLYLLARGRWAWVVSLSLLFWHLQRLDPTAFTFFRVYFNPALWQILFTAGILIGYYRTDLRRLRARWLAPRPQWAGVLAWLLAGSALALLVLSFYVAFRGLWAGVAWLDPKDFFFTKNLLAPGRVMVSIWVLAGLYELLSLLWQPTQRLLGWLLIPLGQNSLSAYVVQASLAYLVSSLPGYPFAGHAHPEWMMLVHFAAFLLVWAVTLGLGWLDRRLTAWRMKQV